MAKKKAAKKKKVVKRAAAKPAAKSAAAVPVPVPAHVGLSDPPELLSPAAREKSKILEPTPEPFTCERSTRCICGKCDPAIKKPAFA